MNLITENTMQALQELIIRMERNNKILKRLSQKINSYTCEPNDHSCFEKLYNLKRSFRSFVDHQNRIMVLINQKKGEATNLDEDIRLHLKRFKQLEGDVEAYLLELNRHS